MTVSKNAIVSAIRGAFVADAASMGTHWIYDPKEMAAKVSSVDAPEFKDPPTPSFYNAEEFPNHYGPGMLSPYGEQLLFVTEHIASTGEVDGKEMSNAMMKWCSTEYTGRKDHALKTFEENMSNGKTYPDCGADDNQAHCYMKVVPVTCLYAGKPELKEKVEEAIRVHQNNDVAVAFGVAAAIILERVLLGKGMPDDDLVETFDSSPRDSWREAAKFEDLETLLLELSHELMKGKEDSPFYDLAARSCTLPGSFTAPAFLIQREAEKDDAYVTALRSNILGAGDTCSRAVFIGAVLAAADDRCVPQDWVDKMDQETLNRIDAAAAKIADLVSAS